MDAHFWSRYWSDSYTEYKQRGPRTGMVISVLLEAQQGCSIIEIGAGSFRDILFLAKAGFFTGVLEFDDSVYKRIRKEVDGYGLKFHFGDARQIPISDQEYDVAFSNGLVGLFSDTDVKKVIREHLRVSSKQSFIFVHNDSNWLLKYKFKRLIEQGHEVYRIRFFSRKAILTLVNSVFEEFDIPSNRYSIRLLKFGSPLDWLVVKLGWNLPPKFALLFARFMPWFFVERICIQIAHLPTD